VGSAIHDLEGRQINGDRDPTALLGKGGRTVINPSAILGALAVDSLFDSDHAATILPGK
jgi:hypothetical protein